MARKWLPYAPAGMPGVWFDAFMMLPNRAGAYYPNNLFATHANPAAPTTPGSMLRAWCALLPADTAVAYVGTTTKLWTYDGVTTFTDKSRGGGYTNTATDWSFAQYGNITLATNRVDALQTRDASGAVAFADAAGAPPKATIVLTQAEQVLLFNLNDGAEKPDAFASCAPGDYTDWSGSGATTATRIRHRPGGITAAIPFRDYVIAAKRNSVYKLTYTGNTHKWKVELIAIGRGAWGKHDLVNCGDVVIMSGPGGAWKFDGATWTPLTDWFGEVPQAMGSFFSPLSQNVHFIRHSSTTIYSTTLGIDYADRAEQYTYNLVSDAWGCGCFYDGTNAVNASASYRPMTGEPAALASMVAPTALLPDLMWLLDLSEAVEVLKNSSRFGGGALTGNLGSARLTGGVEGIGGNVVTHFGRLTPEFTFSLVGIGSSPLPGDTELLLGYSISNSVDALMVTLPSTGTVASSTAQRRFDFQISAPYAIFCIVFPQSSGYAEILDYQLNTQPDGEI